MVTHYTSLDGVNLQNTWLTIGSYDGVHLGHQQLIKELNSRAHQVGAKSVVLSFHPHPSEVLRGRKESFYLTTTDEKIHLLDELHPDVVISGDGCASPTLFLDNKKLGCQWDFEIGDIKQVKGLSHLCCLWSNKGVDATTDYDGKNILDEAVFPDAADYCGINTG